MRLNSFTVANYRSFLGEQTISFNKGAKNTDAIFGPNGSGKTNLFMAMLFFRTFIQNSTKFGGQKIACEYFLLNNKSKNLPTVFSAEFTTKSWVYLYSFSLLHGQVNDEYLQRKTTKQDSTYTTIFRRASIDKNRYEKHGFTSELLKKTRPEALVLTKAWEENNKTASELFEWLDHFKLIGGNQDINATAKKIIESESFKAKVLDLLRKADLYIQDVSVAQVNMPDEVLKSLPFRDEFKATMDRTGYQTTTTHLIQDESGKVVGVRPLSMEGHESNGTRRIFELAYPLIDTLERGNILYIDEFETFLHPKECLFIVSLFERLNNPKNAQLIINTHNTQIIDQVGRNNVHLLGKNNREATIIGSIPKDVRADDPALEKKYNKGLFGAVPNIKR